MRQRNEGRAIRTDGRHSTVKLASRIGLAVLLSVSAAAVLAVAAADAAPSIAGAPSAKRVTLVADSVGLGMRNHLDDQFPPDWDVEVLGRKSLSISELESEFVRPNLDRLGDHVVVAGGYNFPFREGLAASIDRMVDSLVDAGVDHVYWVTLREVREEFVTTQAWRRIQPFFQYFPIVNSELERAVARHPELTLIDWSTAADRPGVTSDAIHLNPAGIEIYGSLVRQAVGDVTVRQPNGGVVRVNVADPAEVASGDVVAVALNLTSVRSRAAGHVSASPCEDEPDETSNLNHRRNETTAAAAIVRVGSSGDICVYNHVAGHVIVDVVGRFGDDADLLDVDALRALDTREASRLLAARERLVVVADPASADGPDTERTVVLNLTVVRPSGGGYLTVHECGVGPGGTSNVNFDRDATTPNLVAARTNAAGAVCVTSTQDTDLLVDVLGVFGPDSTVDATDPSRLFDGRLARSEPNDGVVSIDVGPPGGSTAKDDVDRGVIANLTIVGADGPGYATAYPCAAGRPDTSNINFVQGSAIANAVVVEPDENGRICVFTSESADVVVDLMATTGSGFDGAVPSRAFDSRT